MKGITSRISVHYAVLAVVLSACNQEKALGNEEVAAIYATVLSNGASPPYARREVAFEPHFMTDSGRFTASGVVPDAVVAFLLRQGLISEVCEPGTMEHDVPDCVARRAHGAIRVSRPLRTTGDSVMVFLGHWTISPTADTSFAFRVASTERCHVVKRDGEWKFAGCALEMIT